MILKKLFLLNILLFGLLGQGCNVTKYLKEEEKLVKSHEIVISKANLKRNERSNLSYELDPYITPKPNSKLLGLFPSRLWAYYRLAQDTTAQTQDTLANTWLEERFTESPVLFRESQIERNLSNLNYVLYQKGFFDRDISIDTIYKKYFVTTKYNVNTGKRYLVNTIKYESKDSVLLKLIRESAKESKLKPGSPVDVNLFEEEKIRLVNIALNNGYYDFNTSYIPNLTGDSTKNLVNITIKILQPEADTNHKVYKIGKIRVYTDNDPLSENYTSYDTTINGIQYFGRSEKLNVRPKVMDHQIYLAPEAIYSKATENLTIRRLSTLGFYRYPVVRSVPSTTDSLTINYDIFLTPEDKMDFYGEPSISRSNQVSSAPLLGLALDVGWTHRNLLRGAENNTLGLEGAVELLPRNLAESQGLFNSAVFRAKNDLRLHNFIDINGVFSLLNKIPLPNNRLLLKNEFYSLLKEEGRSNVSISFEYNFIVNAYTTRSVNLEFNSIIQKPDRKKTYSLTQVGFNLLIPKATEAFQNDFLINNPLLAQSFFSNQLFTGLLFKSFGFASRPGTNRFGETYKTNFNIETSGLEVLAIEGVSGRSLNPDFANFSKFIKMEFSKSYFRDFNNSFGAGAMGAAGIAVPLWDEAGVPYVKKLQVGGPNSMRAWEYRQLGPGGIIDTISNQGRRINNYFQRGDLKLEALGEVRFDLFWVFKGAFFLDIGNVWSLESDDRTEAKFRIQRFLDQIAVGSGLGLRMDFGFFVLRTDFGTKVRLPYISPNTGSHYPYNNMGELFRDIQLNLALDYPF